MKRSGVSIMSAAFIASMLLSILCSFFYNMWVYDVETVILEEGDWQGRIVGAFREEDVNLIRSFANVEKVVVEETVQSEQSVMVLDLYFRKPAEAYHDMTLISEKLGLKKEQITYNYQLLSMYFIRIPGDDMPRMMFPLYTAILLIVCVSLILVIHNSFAVSMNARIHQLGILSSIGATPQQIRHLLLRQATALCTLPMIGGSLAGIGIGYALLKMMNALAVQMTGRHDVTFRYHMFIFGLTMLVSALTVLISAWIPARKLAKLTPLEAIRGAEEMQLKRKKYSPVLEFLFGIEGELAGNALRTQKKALRTSALSLTLSFFGFTIMMCVFKLSAISTDYTYFARYQDAWDVMAAVKNTRIEEFSRISALQKKVKEQGASSCVVYQKMSATAQVPATAVSDELDALGGPETLGCATAGDEEQTYLINTQIVILDDAGFQEYCEQIGTIPRLDGGIIINRIWDSINSNFRYPEYVPYVKENYNSTEMVLTAEYNTIEIPILGYTAQEPVLREEYDDYALVHIVPLSLWSEISGEAEMGINAESDVYVRVLMNKENHVQTEILDQGEELIEDLGIIEETLTRIIGQEYETVIENRPQEKLSNDRLIWGYQVVICVFCSLLAIIGIANIFSYTMGFVRQRRREYARYLSIGMTPGSMKKMFCIEMLVIVGRPVLITLPITGLAISLMIKASYLNPAEFWRQAPYVPILIFIAAIFGFVAVAYGIGGRKLLKGSLVDALRTELQDNF